MFQSVTLLGNLGRDPELRTTASGKSVCSFSIATSRKWQGGEETIWWRISVWEKAGEACHQYLRKGSQVFITGRMQPGENGEPRTWTDKDGNTRASFEVTAHEVKFIGGRQDRQEAPAASPAQRAAPRSAPASEPDFDPDVMPF